MKKHYGDLSHIFVNLIFGVSIALGFLEWMGTSSTMQYVLFLFTYVLVFGYWLSHRENIRNFPPKDLFGVLIDVTAVFVIFLIMKSASLSLGFYFAALAILRAVDALGISRITSEYVLKNADLIQLRLKRGIYFLEAVVYVLFESLAFDYNLPAVFGVTALMLIWLFGRVSEKMV